MVWSCSQSHQSQTAHTIKTIISAPSFFSVKASQQGHMLGPLSSECSCWQKPSRDTEGTWLRWNKVWFHSCFYCGCLFVAVCAESQSTCLMILFSGVPVSSRVSAKIQQLVNTLKRPKRPPLREFFVDDFEELLEGERASSYPLIQYFCDPINCSYFLTKVVWSLKTIILVFTGNRNPA